jgi:hypothetical protein
MPRRLVRSTLVYFGLAEPPRRDNAPLSDTALVIRWVPWLLLRAFDTWAARRNAWPD